MSDHFKPPEYHKEYEQYLQYIVDLDMTLKEKYELLHILNAIIAHFVDTAFGVQPDQIMFESLVNEGSNPTLDPDIIEHHPETETDSAPRNGVARDSNPLGTSEP